MEEKKISEEIETSDESQDIDVGNDEVEGEVDGEENEEQEQPEKKKNTSNFKKLNKALKGAMATIKELEAKLEGNTEEKPKGKESVSEYELRLFVLENPEARDYKEDIQNTLARYPDMSIEEALAFAKVKNPVSKDKKDIDLKNKQAKQKKALTELSPDEALQLDNKSYLEYMRKTGKLL
jgi:hypothetical protein